ncbi:MAG: phosphate--acyl-ACP acyltransferase [Eubacteriaceae bacterium]|jgi:glycerol-3-phosphate acyltransferase PlsX|nr:phosphate--acyl-ACP acyltransferase [Eubacteriaceae bacterium]
MAIYLDAMGGDNAPLDIVRGALLAQKAVQSEIVLLGQKNAIEGALAEAGGGGFAVVECAESIEMGEEPAQAVRRKKGSSIVRGCQLIRGSEDSAFVSAGSTGALLAAGLTQTGRLPGMQRAALGVVLPAAKPLLLLDAGANADLKPEALVQIAYAGIAYMRALYGLESPKAGLANIGAEAAKGSAQSKSYFSALSEGLSGFIGNIEPRDAIAGACDVLCCDGFTGNIILKTLEGAFAFALEGFAALPGLGAEAKASLSVFRESLDPASLGGAPFLGLDGCLIKAHGASGPQAIASAVRQASLFLENGALRRLKADLAFRTGA